MLVLSFLEIMSRLDFEEGKGYRQMEGSRANDTRKHQWQDSVTHIYQKIYMQGLSGEIM